MPQYYQYEYTATGTSFTARARACREDMGSFSITGRVEGGRVIVGEVVDTDWKIDRAQ
jgi:hypothetical protein